MTNQTLMSIMLAGACVAGVANTAEAHPHHHGDKTAQRIGATGMLLEGVADVVGALTGQPTVVAPVATPVVATPVVAAPAPVVATPVVVPAPVIAPAPRVIVATPHLPMIPPPPPPRPRVIRHRPPMPRVHHPAPVRGRGCR